jgi:zinc finger protein
MSQEEFDHDVLEGETCPFCMNKTLTLMETAREIPFFGVCHIFSMSCTSCKYHKADVEAEEPSDPVKYTLDISEEEDMNIRLVKSSSANIKIPYIGSIDAGEASNGYITNVQGVFERLKKQVEHLRDATDDKAEQKKAKNILKKIMKIQWGQEKAKIILEDPTGNSAIVSPKAKKEKLKKKK